MTETYLGEQYFICTVSFYFGPFVYMADEFFMTSAAASHKEAINLFGFILGVLCCLHICVYTVSVLCTGLLSVCMYYSGCFCFQTEAIHPDCALVVQHMKAQEECNEILKQEENNHSTRTGLSILINGLKKKITH